MSRSANAPARFGGYYRGMERTPHSSSRHKALVDFALPLAFLVLASLVAWAYPQLLESGGMRGPVVVAGEASKGYATTVTYLLIAAMCRRPAKREWTP